MVHVKGTILKPVAERLERTTIPEALTGCWLCWAAPNNKGYPRFNVCHQIVYAHRFAWEQANGRKLREQECVLHRCDTPACVNPAHLFVGTHKDNAIDREAKGRGRQPRGLGNARAFLSDDQVRAIYADRRKARIVAAEYGVRINYVYAVHCGMARRFATGHQRGATARAALNALTGVKQ